MDFNDPATREKIVIDTIRKYSTDTVYFKDKESRFIWNSLGHIQQLGAKTPEEVFGKTDFDYFPKDFAQSAISEVRFTLTKVSNSFGDSFFMKMRGL